MTLFPFAEFWWFYLGFILFVLFVLGLDLGVFHKDAREVSLKESSMWTAFWITIVLIFNVLLYFYLKHYFSTDEKFLNLANFDPVIQAKTTALEFLTGYVIEKSLAIDNIFIFAVVFGYFSIPNKYQHKILFWGILGAIVFRAIFIAIGSLLMQYHWVVVFFGGLLILTGIKMMFAGTNEQNLENNFIVKTLKRVFRVHPVIEGESFFIKKNGLTYVTPLFLALIFLELTDIIFAVDSVPAIFAISKEPLIVFTSNIFAILGLRSMYFLLAGVLNKFVYIKYGLAAVLVFVGLKMVWLNQLFDGKFPIHWSLIIIAFLIGSSIIISVLMDQKKTKNFV